MSIIYFPWIKKVSAIISICVLFASISLADSSQNRLDTYRSNKLLPIDFNLPQASFSAKGIEFSYDKLSWVIGMSLSEQYAKFADMSSEDWQNMLTNMSDIDQSAVDYLALVASGALNSKDISQVTASCLLAQLYEKWIVAGGSPDLSIDFTNMYLYSYRIPKYYGDNPPASSGFLSDKYTHIADGWYSVTPGMYYAASGSIQDIDFSKIVGLDYASAQAYSEPIYCLGTTEGYINCIMGAWSPMSYLPESNKTGMKLENCDIRKWNLTEDWVRNTLERTTSHWGTSNVWTNITISEQQESVLGEVLKEYNVTYTVK